MYRNLVLTFLAYLASLICAYFFAGSVLLYIILWVGATALFLLLRLEKCPLIFCLLAFVFAAGFSYGEWREQMTPTSPLRAEVAYQLTGQVVNRPSDNGVNLRFDFKVTAIDGEPVAQPFNVRIFADSGSDVAYGNTLSATGNIFADGGVNNPGEFDYGTYLANQNILNAFSTRYGGSLATIAEGAGAPYLRMAYFLRDRLETSLAFLPADQAALILGIFFGDKTAIDEGIATDLSRSGLMHAFAVSGLHVGYVILFIISICAVFRLGLGWRLAILALFLTFYCAMVGFTPSVLRASLMAVMLYIGLNLGRERDGYTALAAAAFLILLFEPKAMLQISFQLSFAAMLGILYFRPLFHGLLRRRFPGKAALIIMFSAQLGIMPLLVYYFHTVSFISLFISVFCCFIIGGIVILTLIALPCSLVAAAFGALPLYAAGFLADLTVTIIRGGANLPFAFRYLSAYPIWQLLIVYGFLLLIPRLPFLRYRQGIQCAALVCILAIFFTPFTFGQQLLRVSFLAVGNGNAVAIMTPSGKTVLVDAGGSSPQQSIRIIEGYLMACGVNQIDLIVNSHSDSDHSCAIPEVSDFFTCPKLMIAAPNLGHSAPLLLALAEQDIACFPIERGDRIEIEPGLALEVLWPAAGTVYREENESSLIMRLTYGDISFLFTGDVGRENLDRLASFQTDLQATVLELPHHGSLNSYAPVFYQHVMPDYLVANVGENNYGHPSMFVTNYWQERQVPLYRTDREGAISFLTDGQDLTVETFH